MNNLKRVLIIALCSILCVCTVPRFSLRSEAASTSTYALYQTLLNLSGYLTTRGYSIVHEYGSSIPSITEFRNQTKEGLGKVLFSIAQKLDAFGAEHDLPDLGQRVIAGAEAASLSGAIIYSKEVRELLDLYFQENTSNGSVSVGSITKEVSDFYYPADTSIDILSGENTRTCTPGCEFICFTYYRSGSDYGYVYVLPTSIDNYILDIGSGRYVIPGTMYPANYYRHITYNNRTYEVPGYYVPVISRLEFSFYTYGSGALNSDIIDTIFNAFYNDEISGVDIGSWILSRLTDTSTSDLLTSTNTVSSDSTVEGPVTIYLPSETQLETLIDDYNTQSISYDDFLKALGINSVASDSTVQEKEDALATVSYPSVDYDWFTKTKWGADTIEETRKASASTRAEEDSLADSIANTANGGSDPDDPDNKSRGKGLLALLLLGLGIWNTPIIAGDGTPSSGGTDDGSGDDGSGDTSGYLAESIAGMAVAGSLIDDFFDSAGGSDGYGLIYTVGASFVIFSVIIGASNYFGALFHGSDTNQNIKSSGKQKQSGKRGTNWKSNW